MRSLKILEAQQQEGKFRDQIGSVAEVRWTCRPDRPSRGIVRELRRSSSRQDVPMELTMLAGGELYARPTGDAGNLPIGSTWTLQGAIINSASSSNKPASVTNAVVICVD